MAHTSSEPVAGFNARTGAYHVRHDWDDDSSLTELVVCSVAAVVGIEPMDVDPLSTRVDTDALESLFAVSSSYEADGSLTFHLNDCRVTVYSDGEVVICPPGELW